MISDMFFRFSNSILGVDKNQIGSRAQEGLDSENKNVGSEAQFQLFLEFIFMGLVRFQALLNLFPSFGVMHSRAEVAPHFTDVASHHPIESEWAAYAQLSSIVPRDAWLGQAIRANAGHWRCWTPIQRDYYLGFWYAGGLDRISHTLLARFKQSVMENTKTNKTTDFCLPEFWSDFIFAVFCSIFAFFVFFCNTAF